MEVSAYGIAVIGVGATIAGALIGALVTYWLSISLVDRTAKQMASAHLRHVFASIQSRIRSGKITEWNEFRAESQNLFDNHAIEFEKFRCYVHPCQLADYDAAFSNYRNLVFSRSIVAATTQRGTEPDHRTDCERYLDVLDDILRFAKP